jgi:alanine racemase
VSQNLSNALALLPPKTRLCAVVKADAYGHGINHIVPLLITQGIGHIGISSNAEARAVREAGFAGTLLRLRTATPAEVRDALDQRVEELVGTEEALQALIARLGRQALPRLHLSLNADGMSRDGIELSTDEGRRACARILELAQGRIAGLCTHFPSNQPDELAQSVARFQSDLAWIFANSALRRQDVLVHAGSTLTLASGVDPQTDMMRCGAILYGIAGPGSGFQTTLTLKSRVTSIGRYPKGSTIGYDRSTTLRQDSRLASVALGYANGYCRQLAAGGEVLIRGQRFPVMGKISMNTIVVDVTMLADVAIADEVVAFGQQGGQEITSQSIEQRTGTIMADLFTDWGLRNPRVIRN